MKNKIIILILLCFLLCGCKNYRDLNELAIITGVAIDKTNNTYELSFLTANSPKSQTTSKEGEAQTTVYSGKGKTLSESAKQIDFKNPKKLYLGHINVVIISEEIGKEGFLNVADFLLRYPGTRSQFYLMQAKNTKAKEILKIVSPLESFPSQGIATLLESSEDTQSVIFATDYLSFIEKILEKGNDPVLPSIEIKGNEKKGSTQKNLESTQQQAYLNLTGLAIYKKDKFKGYATYKESQLINTLNNMAKEFKYTFKYKNNNINISSSTIKTKTKIKNPNTIEINIKGQSFITEINTKDTLENPNTIKNMQKKLNQTLKKDLNNIIKKTMQKYKADVFGYGNKIYKNYPKEWKKIEKNWENKYYQKLNIKINTNLKIKSTGALDKTIREVE